MFQNIVSTINLQNVKESYWPNNYYVSHANNQLIEEISKTLGVLSVVDIIEKYKNPIMAVGECIIDETEGIYNKMVVAPDNALEWYKKGAALEFDCANIFFPELENLLANFKDYFNLPQQTMSKVIFYAAKNGGGFGTHFDSYTNSIFQLKGKKSWSLAPNHNVKFPLEHYEHHEYPYIPSTLSPYWDSEVEPTLSDSKTEILDTCSFLYLPRGVWHSTESDEETLALNITLGQPTWIDVISKTISNKMSAEESFRELIAPDADIHLMKEKLINHLESLSIEDILQNIDNNVDIYQQIQYSFRKLLENLN